MIYHIYLMFLGWCLLETGARQAPGSVWNISECEVCACRDAQVVCNEVSPYIQKMTIQLLAL